MTSVLDKTANFVVIRRRETSGTVLNALLHHCPALSLVPRAGIVHRLDKDTGLMVVAKTLEAHNLVVNCSDRLRVYQAVVTGLVTGGVDQPIGGIHVKELNGQPDGEANPILCFTAFSGHSHPQLKLEQRTHQIRAYGI